MILIDKSHGMLPEADFLRVDLPAYDQHVVLVPLSLTSHQQLHPRLRDGVIWVVKEEHDTEAAPFECRMAFCHSDRIFLDLHIGDTQILVS